jgi:divalent metal cation (Fe/Co/Zn/Cd) transporter
MAKKKVSVTTAHAKKARARAQWQFPFGKTNIVFFGIALAVIVLGYALMATGISSDPEKYLETWANPVAIVVAPAVLVVAYCVLIPIAIMRRSTDMKAE